MGTITQMSRKKLPRPGEKKGAKRKGARLASRVKTNRNCRLETVWVWPETVTEKLRPLITGCSINVCCGLSDLCGMKVDIEPRHAGVIKADMNDLPYVSNTFDTVVSDPPWKLPFFKRMLPFRECVRICKVDGRIIYNCVWKPVNKYVELERAILRTDNNFANVSVIWIFRKVSCQTITKEKEVTET